MSRPRQATSRVLGIDLGTRRIGLAVSDGLGLTAQPHSTLERTGGQRDLQAIATVAQAEGRAAKSARAFAERLQAALGLPVELFDESFSTVEAEEVLLAADLSRARRRQVVDRLAASVILQRWLDAHRPAEGTGT
jgi:putative holliday junction resolvase